MSRPWQPWPSRKLRAKNSASESRKSTSRPRLDDETAIVALPHEVFVDIGLAIKATSPFKNTIVNSLSGDVDFYIPTRRAFTEGSYEVVTCPLDEGCGEVLLDCARDVLNKLQID